VAGIFNDDDKYSDSATARNLLPLMEGPSLLFCVREFELGRLSQCKAQVKAKLCLCLARKYVPKQMI